MKTMGGRDSRRAGYLYLLGCIMILAVSIFSGCSRQKETETETQKTQQKEITVGFSQLGAESDWRSANSESMREAFTDEDGYRLFFEDGQQKQTNQITAIRKFIQQGVDYIVLAPVTETGWDTVLGEAHNAGIPVIIVDRMVDVEDEELFTCRVGSDFELEGKKAAQWLHDYSETRKIAPEDLHIVNIQGTIGATAQIGRTKGLADAADEYGWDLIAEVPGDFTQTKGHEVMESLLEQYQNINVVYCENDNSALGAIEAIEEAGLHTGSDIAGGDICVISFDGVKKEALEYVLEDKITCIAQCNPKQGPLVRNIIEMLEKGETPEKVMYTEEEIYCADDSVQTLTVDGKQYPVTILSVEKVTE